MRDIKWITLHCTAGPQTQSVQTIKNYWKSLGWKKYGYHHLISPDGTDNHLTDIKEIANGVEKKIKVNRLTQAEGVTYKNVAGYNYNSIHISYIGGVDGTGRSIDNRTDAQKATQTELVRKYMKEFPGAIVLGHRDFSPDKNRDGIIQPNEWMKTCPSFEVKDWLKESGLITSPEMPVVKKVVTSGGNLNMRSGPGILFDVVASLTNGSTCMVMKVEGEWTMIRLSSGKTGYVKNQYLK